MFDKEFYAKVKCYSDAHDLPMSQGIRQYIKENNIEVPPSVPADPKQVQAVIAQMIMEERDGVLRALREAGD